MALDSEPLILRAAAGLVWLAMLFSSLLVVQRAFAIETDDAALDSLLIASGEPAQVFFGKTIAAFVQLLSLAVLLVTGASCCTARPSVPRISCCWSRRC